MKLLGFRIGGSVVARCEIIEDDFPRPGLIHQHAATGDVGTVIGPGCDVGWLNVRWTRTKTITVCHVDEIRNELD